MRKGFTFIEFMLALGLISILLILTNVMFNAGIGLWRRNKTSGKLLEKAMLIDSCLERDLKNSLSSGLVPFRSKKNSFSFLLRGEYPGEDEMISAAVPVEYLLRETFPGNYSLVRISGKPDSENLHRAQAVVPGLVGSWKMSYLYQKKWSSIEYEWKEFWSGEENLPAGIKFEYELLDGKENKSEKFSNIILLPAGRPGISL